VTEEPRTPDPTAGEPGGVWEYVRRRSQLDEEIVAKFARPLTIMFTDIRGSTTFFDMRGDLEGVTMIQRHNELVFPKIEAAGGRVLARLGDGLLVTFPTPAPAVRAAIEIQKRLEEYNQGRQERDQIHVRVGINAGMGFVEEQNVFGDAVNVAARVETLAEPDQILVSESVYNEVMSELGTDLFLPHGPAALKGKLEKVVVFEVVWSPERTRLRTAVRRGAFEMFHLGVSRIGDRLKVTSYEHRRGDEETLRTAEEWGYEEREVADTLTRIDTILAAADPQGQISKAQLDDLVGLGHLLYERMLPPETRARLAAATSAELLLRIDEHLVQLPWELMHDGQEFLCLRFAMGRVVSTSQPLASAKPHELRAPLRIALITAATQDLPEAADESAGLVARLAGRPEFDVVKSDHEVGRDEFLRQFAHCDILHFAGHTDYDRSQPSASGFRLADGRLSAGDLGQRADQAAVPRVVFVNACESARGPEWRGTDIATVFGLANAFLLAGVKHYVGSVRNLEDRAAFEFALEFYGALGSGLSIGVAVREARREMVKRQGKTSLTWASYVLYGDPTSRYLPSGPPLAPTRGVSRKRLAAVGVAAGAVIGTALVFTWFLYAGKSQPGLDVAYGHLSAGRFAEAANEFGAQVKKRPAHAYEGLALVAFKQNDFARAERLCVDALRLDAKRPGCLLMQGDLSLAQADTKRAASAYESVIALAGVPAGERATAFNRLGRVAAEQGQHDQAAAAYAKAQEADPRDGESLSNLGALLRRQGRYAEARPLLEKAAALRPGDPLIQALLKETREAETSTKDQDRQKRIDALVGELVQRYRSGDIPRPASGGDEWTSRPLTLSLLGIESKGRIPFREGEHDFLLARLGQILETEGRVRLVERAVMDKLLAELKLSSSALVDRSTALKLGRLLSARLISVGSIASSGNEWQLTVRVIETETSIMVASAAQSMPLTQAVGPGAEALGKELAAKLRRAYPLRARVLGVDARGVILNVGVAEGAAPSQRLQVFREGRQGLREVAGEVEIVEVEDQRSRAKPLGEPKAIVAGLRAREL
jgi:class 3 adenylate cyclase/CHAT domain-containing protein/tetratricopeptide (TPR) repeat protein